MTTAKGASLVSNRAKDFELLDSPGIIPLLKKMDQSDALLLAACNSIGSAAYDNQGVASHLMQWIQALHLMGQGDVVAPEWRNKCLQRYGFDPCVP
jgi:ribosome biogenesis GTPase A